MPTAEIKEFAKLLVRQVRDNAVRNCDALLAPNAGSPVAKRWRSSGGQGPLPPTMIPDVVDEAMFSLLQAIDQGSLRLRFISSNGNEVDLTDAGLGELSGWYMGSGGWRVLYAEERFVDDFSDIKS